MMLIYMKFFSLSNDQFLKKLTIHSARKGTNWYFYTLTVEVLINKSILEIILAVSSAWFKNIHGPVSSGRHFSLKFKCPV